MTTEFMADANVASRYGFVTGSSFDETFSKVSIESILFYIEAACVWLLEKMFDSYKAEVDARIEEILPHRPKWYRDKVMAFMANKVLLQDKDYYDTTGMDQADIAEAMVVKHATAKENDDSSILTIKVAGETNGERAPLSAPIELQLMAYIGEIKDAGVRVSLVNSDPDVFNCECDVYYDPMKLPEDVQEHCEAAIQDYIENLPFDGEYNNMTLVDTLQNVEGVEVVEFCSASSSEARVNVFTPINAKRIPAAGYYVAGTLTLNMYANG